MELGALTMTLAVVLFVDGLTRIVFFFYLTNMKPVSGWGLMDDRNVDIGDL